MEKDQMANWEDLIRLIFKGAIPLVLSFYVLFTAPRIIQAMDSNLLGFSAIAMLVSLYALFSSLLEISFYLRKAINTILEIPTIKMWLWIQNEKINKKEELKKANQKTEELR